MILSFSHPEFEELMKKGVKTFTIRRDKHGRWRAGMKIHFWKNSPRNPSKDPYSFGEGICSSVEYCYLYPGKNSVILLSDKGSEDTVELNTQELLDVFAVEDGFKSWEHLKKWFTEDFEGRIIRWDYSRCIFY
ncbi:MAG: ASCH domain-containing protein [Bacteroidia bacterium]